MTFKYPLAVLLAAAALSGPALAVEYNQVVPTASHLRFISKQMGVPVEGQFKRFQAQFSFDPAMLSSARAAIDIDVSSIDAGSAEANAELLGKNWFATTQFSTARFVTTGFSALGGNRYQVTGKLTIRDVTRDVSAPFTFANGVFEGRYLIKRLDYGLGRGVWADIGTVADDVEVRFRFTTLPARK